MTILAIWVWGLKGFSDIGSLQLSSECCRNTDSESRPGFYEICSQLNIPDMRMLKWSAVDVASYSEESRTVGAPLAEGETLFTELQNAYTVVLL